MAFELTRHEILVDGIIRNASPARLYEDAVVNEQAAIGSSGALIIRSGEKTGRSPLDKRIVEHPDSSANVWWGAVNFKLDERVFVINRQRVIDYLNTRPELYVFDGFAGWDPRYRQKVRVICARAYHALFMHNMLIRPTPQELEGFGEPDYVIYNAGQFPANPHTHQMTSRTSIDFSLERREIVILGTEYAGEMKKGIFTVMHYLMPEAVCCRCIARRMKERRATFLSSSACQALARRRCQRIRGGGSSATTSTAGATAEFSILKADVMQSAQACRRRKNPRSMPQFGLERCLKM